mgnify:CR=1 FL=1
MNSNLWEYWLIASLLFHWCKHRTSRLDYIETERERERERGRERKREQSTYIKIYAITDYVILRWFWHNSHTYKHTWSSIMSFMIDQILASSSTTTNKSRLVLHSLTNTLSNINNKENKQRRMWKCEICLKAFDRPSLLTRHIRTHTGKYDWIQFISNYQTFF